MEDRIVTFFKRPLYSRAPTRKKKNRFNKEIQFEINAEASGLEFDVLKVTKLAQLNTHLLNIKLCLLGSSHERRPTLCLCLSCVILKCVPKNIRRLLSLQ